MVALDRADRGEHRPRHPVFAARLPVERQVPRRDAVPGLRRGGASAAAPAQVPWPTSADTTATSDVTTTSTAAAADAPIVTALEGLVTGVDTGH